MYKDILVSVIITTYKRPKMLERAIASVLKQSHQNIEILVVDDNNPNTDYRRITEDLMSKYAKNNKVRYLKHGKNKNGAAARNTGIQEAKGKYVTYLDDDDIYAVSKVEKQVAILEKTGVKAAYCGWEKNGIKETPKFSGNLIFETLSGEFLARTNILMMDTQVAREIGGWDPSYRRNQEVGYLSRYFSQGYEMVGVPEVLVYFDESDRTNASNPRQSEKDYLFMLHDQRDAIKYASQLTGRDEKIIYSYRLRTNCLKYLASGDLVLFMRAYLLSTMRFPIRFNIDFAKYAIEKLIN